VNLPISEKLDRPGANFDPPPPVAAAMLQSVFRS
jgi:hypothetical protein